MISYVDYSCIIDFKDKKLIIKYYFLFDKKIIIKISKQ